MTTLSATNALITACNSALAKIAKGSIASIDEESIEAKYCAIFAPELLREMADWTHWPDLIKRVTLAPIPNDRPAEWNFAYALPADFGEPLAIREQQHDAPSLPIHTPPFTLPQQDRIRIAYLIEGKVIYTNVEEAIFVYTRDTMRVDDMTPKMRRAFVDELAYRLASPVGKMNGQALGQLSQEAFANKLEAISDAQNKTERFEPNYMTMAEMARMGMIE
jgi:hypothetical protein